MTYSASKAAADLLVRSYVHTFHFPGLITRCSNNYGPYQFPEKLIPLTILNARQGKRLPVYGDGKNVRDWLFVEDHCEAIVRTVASAKSDCRITWASIVKSATGNPPSTAASAGLLSFCGLLSGTVITAVGMVDDVRIMIAAVVCSVGLMMLFAGPIGRFVSNHPTIKMLALSFLLLIGVALVAEAFHQEIPKGYIYFAMAFSLVVEMINIKMRKKADTKVKLRQQIPGDE